MTGVAVDEVSAASVLLFSDECARHFDPRSGELLHALHLASCPVCNDTRLRLEFVQLGFRYVRCRNCGFMFVNPRLDDTGSADFYNSPFYNALLESEYYRIRKFGDTYYSSSTEPQLLEVIARTVAGTVSSAARVVDLGCGGGALLRLLKDRYGFSNAMGVDYNRKAVEFAREVRHLDVVQGDAKTVLAGRKYDLVTTVESIEHVNDLEGYLKTISGLLQSTGRCLITTPRDSRLACRLFGRLADNYMAPNHINYFNERNLARLLSRFGFRTLHVQLFRRRRGLGLLYRRFLAHSEYVAFVPPVAGPTFAAVPRSYLGDVREYIRTRYAFVAARPQDFDGRQWRKRSLVVRLARRAAGAVAIPIQAHMLLIAEKV